MVDDTSRNRGLNTSWVKLVSGSALAQGLTFLTTLWLVRHYSPAEFGRYAVVLSLGSLFGTIWMLRYEQAFALTDSQEVRKDVMTTLAWLGLLVTLLWVIGASVIALLLGGAANLSWMLVIPVMAFSISAYTAITQWLVVERSFGEIAKRSVALAVLVASIQVGLALAGVNEGLIIGALAGRIVVTVVMAGKIGIFVWLLERRPSRRILKNFADIPKHSVPSAVLNAASLTLVTPLLGYVAGDTKAGLFGAAFQMTAAPLAVLTASTTQVITGSLTRQRGSEVSKHDILRTWRWLLLFSVLLLLVCAVWAKPLTAIALGDQWMDAAMFLPPLGVATVSMLLGSPLHAIWNVSGMFRRANAWSIARAFLIAGVFTAGFALRVSAVTFVWTWAIATAIMYFASSVDCFRLLRMQARP